MTASNTIIFLIFVMVIVFCLIIMAKLQNRIKDLNNLIVKEEFPSPDIKIGNEIIYAQDKRGIVLKCPDTGLTYTILTKNGTIKFLKEHQIIKSGCHVIMAERVIDSYCWRKFDD